MDIMQGLQSILGGAMPDAGGHSQANAGAGLGGLAGLLNPEVLGDLANSLFAGKGGQAGGLGATAGASGGGLGGLIGSLLGGAPTPGLNQAHDGMTRAGGAASMFGAAPAAAPDPKAKAGRLIRALIYAAKADGNIDEREQAAINSQLARANVGPEGQELVRRAMEEPLDPNRIADGVSDSREALQLYALSSAVCNADQFMERSYLDKLAEALRIPADVKSGVEAQLRR